MSWKLWSPSVAITTLGHAAHLHASMRSAAIATHGTTAAHGREEFRCPCELEISSAPFICTRLPVAKAHAATVSVTLNLHEQCSLTRLRKHLSGNRCDELHLQLQ